MQPSDRDGWLFEPEEELGGTVAAAVYRRLIDLILFGELAQGSRLLLADLARRFDVSLTPVREALQRLAANGFIEAEPRRGYRVRSPSARHVADLWQVRRGLEAVAAGAAALRVRRGEGDLAGLAAIQSALDRAPGALDHRRHMELNARFHQELVRLSDNALLLSLYRGIQFQLLNAWVQRGTDGWRDRLAAERAEHHALIEALRAGDEQAAAAAASTHIARSLGSALRDLEHKPRAAEAADGRRPQGRTP